VTSHLVLFLIPARETFLVHYCLPSTACRRLSFRRHHGTTRFPAARWTAPRTYWVHSQRRRTTDNGLPTNLLPCKKDGTSLKDGQDYCGTGSSALHSGLSNVDHWVTRLVQLTWRSVWCARRVSLILYFNIVSKQQRRWLCPYSLIITNYMAFNTAGIIHYLAITCYFVQNFITVVLKTLLAVRLIALLIIVRQSYLKIINCKLQALFAR